LGEKEKKKHRKEWTLSHCRVKLMGRNNVQREKKVERRERMMMTDMRQGQRRPGGILMVI
jgi:hypothetical protein